MAKNDFSPWFRPYDGKKKAYVSGPMTGYTDLNSAAFARAAEHLRGLGYAVCNPVETSDWLGHELPHATFLRFDFERVLEADFLVALPGWERSLGAIAEILMATRIDTKVWSWEDFEDYNRIRYEDVEKAISALHLGEAETTTVLTQPQNPERPWDNVWYPAPGPDDLAYGVADALDRRNR